jgi:predicted nucleic-acid-binding protein
MGIASVTWVMRSYYKFSTAQIAGVMNRLLASPQVTVEDRDAIVRALATASVRQAAASCRCAAEKDFNSSNRGGAKS